MREDQHQVTEAPGSAASLRAASEVLRLCGEPLTAALYLVSTPIGNLGDITLRALSVLVRADAVYCEDTRHSRTLLSHYSIRTPLRPYHEHNAEEQRPKVLGELACGKAIALISDAGTPLISDPGYKLAREAIEAGHPVVAIPGASASLAALTVSGLPTDAFFFAGFLPAREGGRRARIEELRDVPGTLAFFEAPTRTGATLADLALVLGARPAVVARELTKLHEDVRRGTLDELATYYGETEPRGEVVIVIGPPVEEDLSDAAICAMLEPALAEMSVRDAARAVAERLKAPKARVYDLALAMRRRGSDAE
ncbi:MAG: 16S rRNA (cytidine(1402)-2'-O)-methyltransferase [Hyphomicrobium sp.]